MCHRGLPAGAEATGGSVVSAVTEQQRALPAIATDVLDSLYQHRLLSVSQIHQLHMPDLTIRWARQVLSELAAMGLIQSVKPMRPARSQTRLWFVSELGAKTVEAAPHLEHRRPDVTPEGAAGPLQAHTLALNEACLAFVTAARERGDECGPLAWRHEVAHRTARGPRSEQVISDAVLRYSRFDEGRVELITRFVELDRATMPMEDLVAKLRRYAQLYGYTPEGETTPAWRQLYPRAFPAVLVVFTGKDRRALERRMLTAIALAGDDPYIAAASQQPDGLVIYGTLLDDLRAHGPFSAILVRHDHPASYVEAFGDPR